MSVVALKRLRIGDGFKEPGDRLSADDLRGRNVRMMIRHGQVSDTDARVAPARRSKSKPEPTPDPKKGDGGDENPLAERSRKELNAIAAELGIDEPAKLPNKEAVIAAIEERTDDDTPDE